jgi:hypothetical protein
MEPHDFFVIYSQEDPEMLTLIMFLSAELMLRKIFGKLWKALLKCQEDLTVLYSSWKGHLLELTFL